MLNIEGLLLATVYDYICIATGHNISKYTVVFIQLYVLPTASSFSYMRTGIICQFDISPRTDAVTRMYER